jgi:Flp pilus assembly protein TadD
MITALVMFALAQTPNPQRAQQFMAEGIHLLQQEHLEDAADRFRKAIAADPTTPTPRTISA